MSRIATFFKDIRDDVVDRHDAEVFGEGFDVAANLCVDLLSSRIADLRTQARSGSPLSPEQALLLAELTDLKDETERQLRNYGHDESADSGT